MYFASEHHAKLFNRRSNARKHGQITDMRVTWYNIWRNRCQGVGRGTRCRWIKSRKRIINPSCPRCTLLCTEKEPNGQSIFIQTMALNFELTSVWFRLLFHGVGYWLLCCDHLNESRGLNKSPWTRSSRHGHICRHYRIRCSAAPWNGAFFCTSEKWGVVYIVCALLITSAAPRPYLFGILG